MRIETGLSKGYPFPILCECDLKNFNGKKVTVTLAPVFSVSPNGDVVTGVAEVKGGMFIIDGRKFLKFKQIWKVESYE